MENAYSFDEYGIVPAPKSRHQRSPPPRVPQYEVPRWRQERPMRNNLYPSSDTGSNYSYPPRMAPPMDRQANRSRSPLNMERRPQDHRSRTPPGPPGQYDFPQRSSSRQQLNYPRPINPYQDISQARPALRRERSESPPQYQRHRPNPSQSSLPYPNDEYSPPGHQFRRSPIMRPAPVPQAFESPRPPRTYPHIATQSITRPSAGPLSDVTRDLVPRAKAETRPYPTEIESELIPRPLNLRSNNSTPRTQTPSESDEEEEGQYLSLDELENLWESQDLYSGTIIAPSSTAKPATSTSATCGPEFKMAPVGISPSLADHPAFRTEMRPYNNYVYA